MKEAPSCRSFHKNVRQHLHWQKLKYLHKYCLNGTQYFPLALAQIRLATPHPPPPPIIGIVLVRYETHLHIGFESPIVSVSKLMFIFWQEILQVPT